MGFDLATYDPRTDTRSEETERLFDSGGFFALAEALSKTREILRESGVPMDLGDPEIAPYRRAFDDLVAENAEECDERFGNYCAFMRSAADSIQERFGEITDVRTGQPPIRPEPEEFERDVRVFMGRAFLDDRPIDKAKGEPVMPAMFYAGALLASFAGHFRDSDPAASKHFFDLMESTKPYVRYLSGAIEDDVPFVVDF